MYSPNNSHMPSIEIQKQGDSFLITEIPFVKGLLQEDLVMIISVFKVVKIPVENLRSRQKPNTQSREPMQLSFL